MKIAVLGATGVVGRNLVPRLVEAGHNVRAGVRGKEHAAVSEAVVTAEVDILDADSVVRFVAGCDALINVASAIPRPDSDSGDWKTYDRIRRDGTRNVLAACDKAGARLVQQSIAMLHAADTSRPQTEDDPLTAKGVLAAGLEVEQAVSAWPGDWRIVRGGSLYGPGTGTDAAWFVDFAKGAFKVQGDGGDWVSPVHVADLAAAFATVLDVALPQTAWIAADDTPLHWNDLFATVARLAGKPDAVIAAGDDQRLPSFRVSNAALRSLGWTPRYASIGSGLIGTADMQV